MNNEVPDGPNKRQVDDALKRLSLGPHERKSPEQLLKEKGEEVNRRVVELVKATFKDTAPHKGDFAKLVGQAFEYEFSKWPRDELNVYMAMTALEQMYRFLYE